MSKRPADRVVTRIAPSPTGPLHIGTARTALFNYLFAKQHGGRFLVRLEDTDRERSDSGHERDILDSLRWLGLKPDAVARQSDRSSAHERYIARLIASGAAYVSREPSKRDPEREVAVVRFRNTGSSVSFTDTVRGEIVIPVSDSGDFVIARGTRDPLYNLATVADDLEAGVTHVIRGDDHIVNTPIQILLIKALGAEPPAYTHVPLVHSPGGGKLSKRKGALSVLEYKRRGYLPDAVVNAIALLGWSPEDDREIFTRDDLVDAFSLDRIQTGSAVFDEKKLLWFHGKHLKTASEARLRGAVVPSIIKRFPFRSRLRPAAITFILRSVRERGQLFSAVQDAARAGEYDYCFVPPRYSADLLVPKGESSAREVISSLERTLVLLGSLRAFRDWRGDTIKSRLSEHAEERGKSLVFWPLRVALSGKDRSPDPFSIAAAIGKKRTLSRLRFAIAALNDIS